MPSSVKGSVFKFCCRTCGQKLSVPEGQQGKKFTCPNCAGRGQVSGVKPRKLAADPGRIIRFHCASCDQKLSAPDGLRGQKFACPNCAARGHVPGAEPRELTAEEREDAIKFLCGNCGQKLSCAGDLVGKSIKCPICHKETIARIGALDSPSTLPPPFTQKSSKGVVLPEKNGPGKNGAGRNRSVRNGTGNNGGEKNGAWKEVPQHEPKPSVTPNGEENGQKEAKQGSRERSGAKQAGKPSWWRMVLGGGGGSLWEEDAEPSVMPIKVSAGNGALKAEAARNGAARNGTAVPGPLKQDLVRLNGDTASSAPPGGPKKNGVPGHDPAETRSGENFPTTPNGHGPDEAPEKKWEPTTTPDELFQLLIQLGFEVEHIPVAQENGAASGGDRR